MRAARITKSPINISISQHLTFATLKYPLKPQQTKYLMQSVDCGNSNCGTTAEVSTIGCFKKFPVRLLGTRYEARNCALVNLVPRILTGTLKKTLVQCRPQI
jgi:hypothetical protein